MFVRRRGIVALGAALVAGGLATVALGQDVFVNPFTVQFTVSPNNNAGTPSRPQGVKVTVKAGGTLALPEGAAPPIVRSVDVWLPKDLVYNGAKHPACTAAKLIRGGPSKCPRGSIMGHTAAPYDPVPNRPPSVTVVNGGPTKMYFWTVLHDPARVQAAIPGVLTKLRSSRWSYRLHADIPGSLQVVAGIPITLSAFSASAGRGDWIATTGCPRTYRWPFHVRLTSTTGQVLERDSSVACRT
jgi:hypothetical protein